MYKIGDHFTAETRLEIYHSFVHSNYCSLVWKFAAKSHIDSVYNKKKSGIRLVALAQISVFDISDSPLKPQIPKTQITECICGYRNGTTKIATDGVIRSVEKGNIP